eukprot:CAMPEP_0171315992 /NCGR_PEP_ID=MMETSP0816-20121228/68821_1 /TAXON_ID=420281 /ORGANISM="Proboscia inermis, Strain CCAP1064/1" /LENGTH=244 /DNA_ID=CAMNT_0011807295 /DNA_START=130 /DNA_END=864 /DNA_ORIENTATION=+
MCTYQGRIKTAQHDSTNGCTVISPLIVINHLKGQNPGISDCGIEKIIDEQSPPVLRNIRCKLGLGNHALIIPSDVHDYLVDAKFLSQDQFVGVSGGNLLDPAHLEEVVNMLANGSVEDDTGKSNEMKKVGVALFFHEHVVSIIKMVLPQGDCWYDLIDSMPAPKNNSDLGKSGGGEVQTNQGGYATRTRCKDIDSLRATLKWYGCSKLSESDCSYIDSNFWDDMLCDFDPRVFQAFAWTESDSK